MICCIGICFTFCVGLMTSTKMGMVIVGGQGLYHALGFQLCFLLRGWNVFFSIYKSAYNRVFLLCMVVGIEIQIVVGVCMALLVNRNSDSYTGLWMKQDLLEFLFVVLSSSFCFLLCSLLHGVQKTCYSSHPNFITFFRIFNFY